MEDNDKQILLLKEIVENNPYTFHILIKKRFSELHEFILNNTKFLSNEYKLSYRIYCVLNNIKESPVCKNTSNGVHFVPGKKCNLHGAQHYCSVKCSNSDFVKIKKTENVFLKKFNATTPLKIKECREIGKQTKLLKYGNENFVNSEKSKLTREKRIKENPNFIKEINEKIRKTRQKRYGNENAYCFGSQQYKDNLIDKYGFYYTNREQFKETVKNFSNEKKTLIKNKREKTCLDKYNVKCSLSNKFVRQKAKDTSLKQYGDKNYNNREQAKLTCIERYGVDSYTQTQMFKNLWNDKDFVQAFISKQIESKKKNNTSNSSIPEQTVYLLLKEKFPSIIRQYCSEKYPFNCDFYVPEKDLYIEFNGTWTHGGHPFDPNNEDDLRLVSIWKEKGTEFYQAAIDNWTRRDVLKRETAKQNSLNFIEFWNIDEAKEWVNKYEK